MSDILQACLGLAAIIFATGAGIALIGLAVNRRPKIVIQPEEDERP